jgi:chromosome segregation ATPase|tara:strand:- start:17781 stop:18422 length:642 start_codon:yes stop_codon:yes gene_type:complete
MSAAIATEQAVERVIFALERAGRAATADNVIEELGGGSKSTVARLLRQRRARSNPQGSEETFPSALLESARPMLSSLYDMACTTERERYRQASERLNTLMNALEDELEAARENEERLEDAQQKAKRRESDVKAQLADCEARLDSAERQTAAAEQAASYSQSAYESLRSKLERAETDIASALDRETRLMRTLEALSARQIGTLAPSDGGDHEAS